MLKRVNFVSIFIAFLMLISSLPVSATEEPNSLNWESKVSDELLEVMSTKSDDDLIPVYIWLNDIDHSIIDEAMIKEKGMDPEIYENDERFQSEIVSEIEANLVSRVGYEETHRSVDATTSSFTLDDNGAYHDDSMSLLDRAIQAKTDEYIMARREISKREHSNYNNQFIEKYVRKDRTIIDVGKYVTRIIVEATKQEIIFYTSLEEVSDLSFYYDCEDSIDMSIQLDQVGAGYSGTKGSSYNNGSGYKGTGIKIGVIEASSGQYDSTCPHLSGIHNTRLFFKNDAGSGGAGITPYVTDHATMVTSIIVGQSVTVGGTTYEGVVPLATVYQTPINSKSCVINAFNNMVDRGVTVINYSGGSNTGSGYSDYDKDIDALITETGITFVKSAGNIGELSPTYITSPGKALNAITVGNADTVTSAYVAKPSPYSMNSWSLYSHASYLPNKPDITAPGTRIRVVKTTAGSSNFYLNSDGYYPSGTSYAAPIVTGIVAQIQQAGAMGFRSWPGLVKSVLATSADPSKIRNDETSPADMSNVSNDHYLWKKSGAGLVNAERAVQLAKLGSKWNLSFFYQEDAVATTSTKYFTAGKKLRVSVVFEKINDNSISNYTDFDDIDLELIDSNGNFIESSCSYMDNIELIEYTIPESGYYRFRIELYRFVHEQYTNLYYYYSWNEY